MLIIDSNQCPLLTTFVYLFLSAKLEGTIVYENAKIAENAQLKDCVVYSGFLVEKEGNYLNSGFRILNLNVANFVKEKLR